MSPAAALRAIVEAITGPRLDRLALYPCRVVSQSSDLRTLDLQPDNARVPPCAGVPILHGLPGITVTVPTGARVLLGYAGGDPAQPYAALWEAGDVTLVSVNGGSTKVALDGGDVTRSAAMATWMSAVSAATGAANPGGAIGAISGGSSVLKVP